MNYLNKFPGVDKDLFENAFKFAQLNTPTRQALFLASVAHESNYMKDMSENLKYSAVRLAQVWPKRFKTEKGVPNPKAFRIAGNEVAIAEAVYGGRMGNGPEGSGDGWLYRGMGPGMLTGKANYAAVDKDLKLGGLLLRAPSLVATPKYGLLAFASWWKRNKMNSFADSYDSAPSLPEASHFLAAARKRVNGGLIGLESFVKIFHEIICL